MINTIIFDFDGTIANTKAFAYQLYSNMCDKYGINKLDEAAFDHLKTLSLVDKFRAHDMSVFKLPKLARRARREIHTVMHEVKPFDGLIDLLIKLKKNGFKLFILSSNSVKNINIFINQYKLDLFEDIYGRAKYLKKEKVLNKLLNKYHLDKSEVLYIGDETRDIVSCKNVDIPIASVSWGFDDKTVLEKENPDFLAETPKALEKYILEHK
ncbi:HAD-IA family hydrolase [Mycoplasmatota bacterium]|nr:HAD-IA family hydrolase [Mycoplasmatota bacterium]